MEPFFLEHLYFVRIGGGPLVVFFFFRRRGLASGRLATTFEEWREKEKAKLGVA